MKRTGGLNALQRALKRALQRALKNASKCSQKARRTLQKAPKNLDDRQNADFPRRPEVRYFVKDPAFGGPEIANFSGASGAVSPHAGSFLGGKARKFPAGVFVS